jgi:hypothetical protein
MFLLAQGVSTLAFRLYPPLDHAFPALLAVTQMIPVHSMLHIFTGLLAVVILFRGNEREAIGFAGGFGLFYLTLGLGGVLSGHPLGLGLQPFDHPIHLALGLVGVFVAYHSSSSRKAST